MQPYCDVALPVPVDRAFTYAVGAELPVIGGRVIVPFRREQMQGVAVSLHDRSPAVAARPILQVLDTDPVLSQELLELGEWIARYYVAPLGEVLRTMLPLAADVHRRVLYRITDKGRERAARQQQPTLSEPAANQGREQRVLSYLAQAGTAAAPLLRDRFAITVAEINEMIAKHWLERESIATARAQQRLVRFAVLLPEARLPPLNDNQQRLLAALASAGGKVRVSDLNRRGLPTSTLGSLAKRRIVRIEEEAADVFSSSSALLAADVAAIPESGLNDCQRETMLQIAASVHTRRFQPFLLRGVTGSGKTAVYIAAMRRTLEAGRSSLMLVPEIGLTPAMVQQLRAQFGSHVALLHSSLSSAERTAQWRRVQRAEARVIVGTRSAVFAPAPDLALIIVDEEHDSSYKQGDLPRYHARDVAVMRARTAGATIVLGSATPSLESWANTQRGKYSLLTMQQRVGRRPLPEVSLIDMRREFLETARDSLVSRELTKEIEETLARGEQAMLLLNRRGYSFVVMCRACGEKIECENCAIAMTHHKAGLQDDGPPSQARERLECHYCGFRRAVPRRCPECDSEHLYHFGVGSQQGEERLQEMFPYARIGRMDRDTMRGPRDYERMLNRLNRGEINLLVGTQMIAKGHDIHGVTLVGVIGVDHTLGLPDFRSAERAFQLLTQVAGRAGRGNLPGRVLVQTHYPDHYAIRYAQQHDFLGFAEHELRYRNLLHYPPSTALANVLIEHTSLESASKWAADLGRWLQSQILPEVRILGPAPAPLSRIKRVHRFHLILKCSSRKQLASAVRRMLRFAEEAGIPRRHVSVDMDAIHLM